MIRACDAYGLYRSRKHHDTECMPGRRFRLVKAGRLPRKPVSGHPTCPYVIGGKTSTKVDLTRSRAIEPFLRIRVQKHAHFHHPKKLAEALDRRPP